jgi:hypothetical protein
VRAKVIPFQLARAVERQPQRRLFRQINGKIVSAADSPMSAFKISERIHKRSSQSHVRLVEFLSGT